MIVFKITEVAASRYRPDEAFVDSSWKGALMVITLEIIQDQSYNLSTVIISRR